MKFCYVRNCAIHVSVMFTLLLCCFNINETFSQSDPLSLDSFDTESVPINEAFNSSYIINNQSSNVLERGRLNFLVLHRFGEISDGAFDAFGMDYAAMRLGFEYGISNKLTAGIGRSSAGKNYDGHLKYRFKTQTSQGVNNFPVSLVLFSSASFSSVELRRQNSVHLENQFVNQLVYVSEFIVSRQFSETLSIEIVPTLLRSNSVTSPDYHHSVYVVSAGGRLRLSDRIHAIADYSYVINHNEQIFQNPVAIGIDIVTGGHTFQLYLTNSVGMIEKEFLMKTTGKIQEANIRIGFTISRSFMLRHKVEGGKIK